MCWGAYRALRLDSCNVLAWPPACLCWGGRTVPCWQSSATSRWAARRRPATVLSSMPCWPNVRARSGGCCAISVAMGGVIRGLERRMRQQVEVACPLVFRQPRPHALAFACFYNRCIELPIVGRQCSGDSNPLYDACAALAQASSSGAGCRSSVCSCRAVKAVCNCSSRVCLLHLVAATPHPAAIA